MPVPREGAAVLRPYKGMKRSRDGGKRSCAEILIGGVVGLGAGVVAVGAEQIDDDSLGLVVNFLLDGGEGAKEEIGGVGHDGSATRGDPVVGLELIEFAEGVVDVRGGAEFLDVADEGGGEVGLVEVALVLCGVFGAEAGVVVGDGQTAKAASRGGAVLAMKRFGIGDGAGGEARGFWIHESSFPA
jgi:hypothetical protein